MLRSLLAPAKLKDKPYNDLVKALEQHYDPKPLVIGQCFQFTSEARDLVSLSQNTPLLHQLSINCEFGTFLDQTLRDHFVCGILSDTIQKKLLTESHDLTIARAQEIALGMEVAEKSSKELQGPAWCCCQ